MRTVRIGDQDYEIHYGQNAICALEDELETSIFAFIHRLDTGEGLGIRDVRALIWSGMLAKRRSITIDAVGALLDQDGVRLKDLLLACGAELYASLGKIIQDDADDKKDEGPLKNE
jgi:hypothetical protein